MKRILLAIVTALIFAGAGQGQGSVKFIPLKQLIMQPEYHTFCVRGEFAGVYDLSKLIFFINEDDYVIPVQLEKKDLGAEMRFLDLNLQEGDVVAVRGKTLRIDVNHEKYLGLVDATILDYADNSEEEEVAFSDLDVKPQFKGSTSDAFPTWVNSQLRYPDIAKKNGIQGRVTVQFTIETNGRVTNVKVLRGVDEALDKEAVRVVSRSPRWSPGYLNGKPVRVTYVFPVIFKLQ